jgi:hypothetical protein
VRGREGGGDSLDQIMCQQFHVSWKSSIHIHIYIYIYIYILFSFPLVRFVFNFFTKLVFWNHAGGRLRHAFIGIGFRERAEAYDFQAALHDHMKYVKTHKCIMYLFNTRITPHRFFVI